MENSTLTQKFKNKKVLVTGGAGFIGSHLSKTLVEMGSEVTVTVKYNSINDNIRLAPIWRRIKSVEADLRNLDSVLALKDEAYDYVFHLAAYNHVGSSFVHFKEALDSNLMATANLLEHGPECDRFLYVSSSESYGHQTVVPFVESAVPNPISPYAIGKFSGELYSRMKRHSGCGGVVSVRAFNTFGPWQSERAVIPELTIKCLLGEPIETTQGRQTREFNYVDDIVRGFMMSISAERLHEGIINLGSGEDVAICDLARAIHELSNSSSELRIGALPDRPTEIWQMSADGDRAKTLLGWEPKVSFREGLVTTINWFKEYVDIFHADASPLLKL